MSSPFKSGAEALQTRAGAPTFNTR